MPNPFKPTAGAVPPLLVGRTQQITDFAESVDNGPGAPGLLTLVTGARGCGKTVMLSALGDVARSRGWVVIDETATPGILLRLETLMDHHRDELGSTRRRRIRALQIDHIGGIEPDLDRRPDRLWRQTAEELLSTVEPHGTGVLLTIDEVHAAARDELTQVAADVQHLIRDGRPIGLVMAGLPSAVHDLLNADVSTFLRRAERIELGAVELGEVRASLAATLTEAGAAVRQADLERAAAATRGYPFMIQLVGYQLYRRLDEQGTLPPGALDAAIDAAQIRLGHLVHAPSLADLSDVDRTVLLTIAKHDGPISTGQIADALGRTTKYVSTYRQRLIQAGMIRPAGYGYVDIALPYLRDYLREHAGSLHTQGKLRRRHHHPHPPTV